MDLAAVRQDAAFILSFGTVDERDRASERLARFAAAMTDQTKPDEDWLRSIGGHCLYKDSPLVAVTQDVGYDGHVYGFGTENYIGWQAVNTMQEERFDIGPMETRGQVLSLMLALGLTLPGE